MMKIGFAFAAALSKTHNGPPLGDSYVYTG